MYSLTGTQTSYVLSDSLPAGGSLSMGAVENTKMNEARAAENSAVPVAPNVLNDALAAGGSLSMGVLSNAKINEARYDVDAAAPVAADTINSPAAATLNVPTAAAKPNAPMSEATADTLSESDTLNVTFAANPQLRRRFAYSKQSLISDKELLWHQHENIPSNVIGVFENDIMYGSAVYVPHPSAKTFDYTIMWYITLLPGGFPIAWYPLCTSVANTYSLQLHLYISINRSKTGNYNFIEPKSQIVQRQGQLSAPTPCRGFFPQTIPRQISGVTLISGMQPVRVPYINAEYKEEQDNK